VVCPWFDLFKPVSQWDTTLAESDDAQLLAALDFAHIPALLATLVHFTGNLDHCEQLRPHFDLFAEEEDGLTEAERVRARQLAYDALRHFRDSGCIEPAPPADADIVSSMHYITGENIPDHMLPFLREELNLFGEDRRRVEIDVSGMPADFSVLIIGSGMSGILAAIRLQQQGIPFTVLEKNAGIGGTWLENTYPGCQVDSANHLYNYIFEPNSQWPNHFSNQAELYAYFERIVEKYGLRQHIRFNCPVISASFDEHSGSWSVRVQQAGVEETLQANAVISAVGQLNIPKMPDIAGLESFAGVAFHSARWEHQHELLGKRVAVIGTGCSAAQFVPEIAPDCAQLKVFQRSAPWLLPAPSYHEPMAPEELWLLREIPFYARWYRFFLFRTRGVDGHLPLLYSEPGWQGPANTIGTGNEMLRAALTEALHEQAGDEPELLVKLIPEYPPGGKRPVLDDGAWIQALKRENVQLHTEAIERVVPEGIVTADGELHEVDVLIYGTGFAADQFLVPMQVFGRGGVELVSQWNGDAHAYKGVCVSNFPNFYTLYGPNTNIVVGSSIVFFVECQMRYITGCLKLQLEQGLRSLECRRDVMDAYNRQIDALNRERAWGSPAVSSWYKNSQGRVTQNWPGTHWEYWQQTQHPDVEDYLLEH
jgi:4-hydroxyacetophenone monooxygenase